MTSFLTLPTEILDRVIFFLDTPNPFEAVVFQKPKAPGSDRSYSSSIAEHYTFANSSCRDLPLKTLSSTTRFLRTLTLPQLFKHSTLQPLELDAFLAFAALHGLGSKVSSLTAHVHTHYNHLHPAWWARLLNALPSATQIAIVAPPEILDALAGIYTWSTDAWAFDMPLQILRLGLSSDYAQQELDYDNLPNLLAAKPWSQMTVNEGSSLMAYTTYEFFLRRTPSLLTALHFNNSVAGDALFANLLSLDFVAIFPFYNHVDEILKCIRKMKLLQHLFVKLCPDPHTTIFRDEIELAGGHMDVNDPWNECETSWMLIAHTVVYLTMEGDLQELQMADVQIEAVRKTLEDSLTARLQEWWAYNGAGSGLWRRRTTPYTATPAGPSDAGGVA